MALIYLHPKDDAKYGVTSPIRFASDEVGVRQRLAFENQTKQPLRWLYQQLGGVPALDEQGNAIPVPAYNVDGSPKLDADGEPVMRPKLTRHPETFVMLAWLTLWGAGVRVPWADFDVMESALRVGPDADDTDEVDEDEGKAPTDSASTTSPTTSPTE